MPSSVIFNYRDGRYAIDSDAGVNTGQSDKNVLTWMVSQTCKDGEYDLILACGGNREPYWKNT